MFSAQVVTLNRQDGQPVTFKARMNVPGNDDRQLALNVLHWLSGLLQAAGATLPRSGLTGYFRPSRGCSSAGRALQSHCRGQGFDPPQLHVARRSCLDAIGMAGIQSRFRT